MPGTAGLPRPELDASPLATARQITDGPTPKHVQLRELLRRRVEAELPAGAPIESERDLSQRYGVSRLTVRNAIGALVGEGLLARVQGRGTFTLRDCLEVPVHLESFTAEMLRRGHRVATTVQFRGILLPPRSTAAALQLPEDTAAIRVIRLRSVDETPLVVERGWYHPEHARGFDAFDLTGSIYSQLADHGVRLDTATQTVWSQAADADTARSLGIGQGAPLLTFRRNSYAKGRPVEDMTSAYRGDSYRLRMRLDSPTVPSSPPHAVGGYR